MKLEVGKTYITRNGLKARCIADDIKNTCSIACAVMENNLNESIRLYMPNGDFLPLDFPNEYDIVSEYKEPEYIPLSWATRDAIREKGGWIRRKDDKEEELLVQGIERAGVLVYNGNYVLVNWKYLLDKYEFLDGTPCGVINSIT